MVSGNLTELRIELILLRSPLQDLGDDFSISVLSSGNFHESMLTMGTTRSPAMVSDGILIESFFCFDEYYQ